MKPSEYPKSGRQRQLWQDRFTPFDGSERGSAGVIRTIRKLKDRDPRFRMSFRNGCEGKRGDFVAELLFACQIPRPRNQAQV